MTHSAFRYTIAIVFLLSLIIGTTAAYAENSDSVVFSPAAIILPTECLDAITRAELQAYLTQQQGTLLGLLLAATPANTPERVMIEARTQQIQQDIFALESELNLTSYFGNPQTTQNCIMQLQNTVAQSSALSFVEIPEAAEHLPLVLYPNPNSTPECAAVSLQETNALSLMFHSTSLSFELGLLPANSPQQAVVQSELVQVSQMLQTQPQISSMTPANLNTCLQAVFADVPVAQGFSF